MLIIAEIQTLDFPAKAGLDIRLPPTPSLPLEGEGEPCTTWGAGQCPEPHMVQGEGMVSLYLFRLYYFYNSKYF